MWSREIIKSNAKTALRGKYLSAFFACAAVAIIAGLVTFLTYKSRVNYLKIQFNPLIYYKEIIEQSGVQSLISLISVLYGIFIGYPLTIGLARFFVRNRFGSTDFRNIFSGFKYGWIDSVGAMFVTRLFIILWALLLIIPGIIKALEYSMVSYILSDNPHLPGSRARQISRAMTDGQKGSIFVLSLSFIGWFLLAAVVGGIVMAVNKIAGIVVSYLCYLAIEPYINASFAELYIFLRDRAIRSNMVSPYELGLAENVPEGFNSTL